MMAGSGCENNGVADEKLRHCESVDSLSDWRSCEQVDNGTPSTSLPYWDISDDDDSGAKPSELHVRFTWKIENYSQTNKRELRSNVFEVGGYNWYILIYPQGCDAPHHLSLFLCVANHDKLLPGWSHFAQFTIAVLNKDPKKTKYSDTLHRFCKKEHDWGWKKFMELTRVSDGFVVADTMVVKAQVQVIREKAHRPFRCLDCEYRRELSKAYLSNVEQICRRFFEERRGKLSKLIEDKVKWSSFRAFWLGIDQNARRRMSRDKTDAILKITVKHFFIEKEVTSTLLMDFLYSGLKALEYQSKNKNGRKKLMEMEESLPPMVHVEKDMFVLADDVLLLLERVALDPLPYQPLPPKDDKCSQNRSKDGSSGDEFNKDSIERDERRLTELARRTLEIFILAHIFCSKIEVAYQEAVALKRQEELIREEEAAENELKAKRGASEKEKRTKKKQAKQKRSSSKVKDRRRDEKSGAMMHEKHQEDIPSNERILGDLSSKQSQPVLGKIEAVEDVSDVSDNGNDHDEALQLDLEERDTSPVNWDTDTSEIHLVTETSSTDIQNRRKEKKSPSAMDDSSSTCSTDSVPSVVLNGPYKGNALPSNKNQTSPNRGKHQRKKDIHGRIHGGSNQTSDVTAGAGQLQDVAGSCSETGPESDAVHSMKNRIQWPEEHLVEKEEVLSLQKKLTIKDEIDVSKSRTEKCSTYISSAEVLSSFLHQRKQSSENTTATTTEPASTQEISSIKVEKSVPLATNSLQTTSISKSEALRNTEQAKNSVAQQTYVASRPLNSPLIPGPARAVPFASTVQTTPLLSRSVSAGGRLGLDPSPSQNYVPQSYRNAIMGKTTMGTSLTGFTHPSLSSSSQAVAYSQSPSAFASSSMHLPRTPARKNQTSVKPGFSFGSVASDTLHSPGHWIDDCSQQDASCSGLYSSRQVNGTMRLDSYDKSPSKYCPGEVSSSVSSQQAQGVMSDEFPHLDIINDLLEEQNDGIPLRRHHHHSLNRQYTFPRDVATTTDIGPLDGSCQFEQPEQFFDGEFQRIYGSRNMAFNGLADVHPLQVDLSGYANGQVNGVFQRQWPFSSADFSMLSLGNADASGYSYHLPDYSTLSCGVSGYMYRPANGL